MASWRSWLALVEAPALAAAVGCVGVVPPPVASELQLPAVSFRALYRLECCGTSRLSLVVAAGQEGTELQVAGGPAGVGLTLWLGQGQLLQRGPHGCTVRLATHGLPLTGQVSVPLQPEMILALLSGRLPAGGQAPEPGWWLLAQGGGRWRVRLVANPPRWVEAWWEEGENRWHLRATRHHGRLPGRIEMEGPGERLQVELLEFRPQAQVAPPPWVSWPRCQEEG